MPATCTDDSSYDEVAAAKAAEQCIEHDVSVYDETFRDRVDAYGDVFIAEYLDEVPGHMGEAVVDAFKYHDLKQYGKCAEKFAEVYTFLFPVDREEADVAGNAYAQALYHHDLIEDGVPAVINHPHPTPPKTNMETKTRRGILLSNRWKHVEEEFAQLADVLDISGRYALHQTDFFRFHTAANEAADVDHDPELEHTYMKHAMEAQELKYGTIVSDADLIGQVAETYLHAVATHDKHEPGGLDENADMMAQLYQAVLADVISQEVADMVEGEAL